MSLKSFKIKRLERDLRKLRSVNAGDRRACQRALNLAYGRTGKLKRELMEPFLTLPTTVEQPPIIPGVEKSRPPVFSRELTALLTSPHARMTKIIRPSHLNTPPTLPPRADPMSEEARLLGPFSKRREVNIRWRYFTTESRKVFPPFEVSVQRGDMVDGGVHWVKSNRRADVLDLGLLEGGFQGEGLLEKLESMAGDLKHPPKTRRERKTRAKESGMDIRNDLDSNISDDITLPTRFLRRRHQVLLGSIPLLTYRHTKYGKVGERKSSERYEVMLPKHAISPALRYTSARLEEVDENNLAWIRRAQEIDGPQRTGRGK
ncbi:hypothetical protein DFH11DRAFT_18696 [Phellopilus nigrolimitatus]|nr:hypothetical protein DFH11DRAFT_18696 [Phellopilus nigrolimitatus]